MTCPRCFSDFDPGPSGGCPECGVRVLRNVSGVIKTSTVMIAAGGERGFYSSVQEVPEPLRTQLIEITNGANAGTIVIADRAGKEQITQVLARRESLRERALPGGIAQARPVRRLGGVRRMVWVGALLFLAAALIISLAFMVR